MLNDIILAGRLVADCEMKKFPDGTPIAVFTLATDVYAKGGKSTIFTRCEFVGSRSETFSKTHHKGYMSCVKGSLAENSYTNKEGKLVKEKFVKVRDFEFLGAREDNPKASTNRYEPKPQAQSGGNLDGLDINDEDLPF